MLFFVGVCYSVKDTFFVALLQPACLLLFTRVFKFLSPLSLPISPPGRVICEDANYDIFLSDVRRLCGFSSFGVGWFNKRPAALTSSMTM